MRATVGTSISDASIVSPLHIPNYVAPQPLHLPRLRHATIERLDGPARADGCDAARADVHLLSTSGASVDSTESPRNARRSRWHGSRRFPSGHPLTGLRSIRMIADPIAVRSPALAANTATATPLRLRLDPNRPAEPYLDGAWWPR